jgi:hypothetical protein
MTSPRQKHDRPIESVVLRISLRVDSDKAAKIKELIPSAQVRGDVCNLGVEAGDPGEVAEKVRILLEKLRTVV